MVSSCLCFWLAFVGADGSFVLSLGAGCKLTALDDIWGALQNSPCLLFYWKGRNTAN